LTTFSTAPTVTLNGSNLSIESLHAIAHGCQLLIDPPALEQMARTNEIIIAAVSGGKPAYGVTTALGPQITTKISADEACEFSLNTIRGRAHAVGEPLAHHLVRAAMAVRLNSLLIGASGASPKVAQHLLECLNANLVPRVGESASVGAADLLWGASMGLALIGEGRFVGHEKSATEVLQGAGLEPLTPGPRDGLALASHSSFSTALAAVGQHSAERLWRNCQLAAALTLEGFQGNLSPLDCRVLKTREQPGQLQAADDLRHLLAGSVLNDTDNARRLQDPLSIRNVVQVHGSLSANLKALAETINLELNGASDNPVVLLEEKEILSGGGYLNPHLATLLVALNHALVQTMAMSVSRSARMMSQRFTDLPIGLNAGKTGAVGLGAVTKVMESLFAEIAQLATPPIIYPPMQADGVEDCITNSAISAKALLNIVDKANSIIALEMIAAVHAIYLRRTSDHLSPELKEMASIIRQLSPELTVDRSLTAELETLAQMLADDQFESVRRNARS